MRARWSRGRPRRAALALAAVLLLAVPAHALAAGTYPVPRGSLVFGSMRGSNGYRIHFSEWTRTHGPQFKVVVDGRRANVLYQVPVRRTPTEGVVANLGSRGRFDLRLRSLGKVRKLTLPSTCEGRSGRWQRGYLVGSARFRGERDYTAARARRIPIVIESWPGFRCHYTEGGLPHRVPRRAQVVAGHGPLGFAALLYSRHSNSADRRAVFSAWTQARAGRISIYREVKVPASESTFAFPGGPKLPEEVTVEPPPPFAGSATFNRSPESTFSWSGDLTVAFPGTGPVRLAGPSFTAEVCAIDSCVRRKPEREPPQ